MRLAMMLSLLVAVVAAFALVRAGGPAQAQPAPPGAGAGAAAEPEPPVTAKPALAKLAAAQKAAVEECTTKIQAARRAYLQELEKLTRTAMQTNQVEEVVRLNAEKQRVEADLKDSAPPRDATTLTVRRAVFGAKETWVDVTPAVAKLVQGSRLEYKVGIYLNGGKDPAPNTPKTLRIDGMMGTTPFTLTQGEGAQPLITLEAGGRRSYP